MRYLILALLIFTHCASGHAAGAAAISDLERLFDAGKYSQFLKLAKPLANKGDPDALYLLGNITPRPGAC